MAVIAFGNSIGPVGIDCRISEAHTSEIEITENPIETGAKVHDHAYIKPKRVVLEVAEGDAAAAYAALVAFQATRIPFYLVTGLAVYSNMLVKAVRATRDKTNAHILRATVELQEVIIVGNGAAAIDVGLVGAISSALAGGVKSSRAAPPAKVRSGDNVTGDRATGTVQRGDARARSVPADKARALLRRAFP